MQLYAVPTTSHVTPSPPYGPPPTPRPQWRSQSLRLPPQGSLHATACSCTPPHSVTTPPAQEEGGSGENILRYGESSVWTAWRIYKKKMLIELQYLQLSCSFERIFSTLDFHFRLLVSNIEVRQDTLEFVTTNLSSIHFIVLDID